MGYIYKYVFNNEIYYIGQTKNLYNRVNQHMNDVGFKGKTFEIYYFETPNQILTNAYELCLIQKYRPCLNTMYNSAIIPVLDIEEPNWILYKNSVYQINPTIMNYEEIVVEQDYYTAIELSKILGIHRSTVYIWKKNNEIIMENNYVSHEELIKLCNKNPGWFISPESAAKFMGISLDLFLKKVKAGIIPSIELNGTIKIAKKVIKKLDKTIFD